MNKPRYGCLTSTGIIATFITLMVILAALFITGGSMFSPGALNAQAGEARGGVTSHAQAACKACHSAPWESARMAERCAVCHTDVAAQMMNVASLHGAITHRNSNILCRDCHPDHRGADAALTVATGADFPHEALGFSLNGHQLRVTRDAFVCVDCHTKSISSFDQAVCVDCHTQMNGSFMQKHALDYGANCLACHDGVDRFNKSFTHNNFSFKLEGKHAGPACVQCHAGARSLVDMQAAPTACSACHQKDDPHQGQFGADCGACHAPAGWTPAKFDHNLSAFKLEGKHAGVDCKECHQNNVFKGTPTDCYSCHAKNDKHGGSFGKDCGACHTPAAWDRVTFDHNKSNFPLTGAHQNVDCGKCHVNAQFAGTPTACASCHTDPVFHAGAFSADCASCHSTSAWSPASFNGSHPAVAEDGGSGVNHGRTTCKTCHPVDVNNFTCLACHTNNQGGGGGG
jgi:hypothetical protein